MRPKQIRRALLVEDDPHDVELIQRALAESGVECELQVAKDGAEALSILEQIVEGRGAEPTLLPDVIFLDLKLPKVSGQGVLVRIKSLDLGWSIPVVVLSSSKEERDLEECYRLGANSYIVKPVDFDELLFSIGNVGNYWLYLNTLPGRRQTARTIDHEANSGHTGPGGKHA